MLWLPFFSAAPEGHPVTHLTLEPRGSVTWMGSCCASGDYALGRQTSEVSLCRFLGADLPGGPSLVLTLWRLKDARVHFVPMGVPPGEISLQS